MDNSNKFFVYVLLDPRKPGKYSYGELSFNYEPFYIGKGSGRRIERHLTAKHLQPNTPKNTLVKKLLRLKLKPISSVIVNQISESEAFLTECSLIAKIGRKMLKLGPLCNGTDGGEGISGHIQSKKTRQKKSHSMMGLLKGRTITKEWRQKISQNSSRYWLGKHQSPESKLKFKQYRKTQDMSSRRNTYIVTSPSGIEYVVSNGLQKFANTWGLNRGHLVQVAYGQRKHHKGWTCRIERHRSSPKAATYKLTNIASGETFITDNIIEFAAKTNLDSGRLYEVAKGKRYIHKQWLCEIVTSSAPTLALP